MRGCLYLATVAVLAGLAAHGTYAGTGDAPHYLVIAHSLAFDFDLDVSNNYGASEPLIASGTLQPDEHARMGAGGILRPVHDVGMPLLFAPYVRVARPVASWLADRLGTARLARWRSTPSLVYRQAVTAAMIAIAGLLAVFLFDVFGTVGLSARMAFWTALLVTLSPPLLVFSILFFTELVSAVFCLVLFRKTVLERELGTGWSWTVAGIATGFLLLVHVRNVALVMSFAAIAIWRLRGVGTRRQLACYLAGVAALVLARTWLTHALWGTWVTTPHDRVGAWTGVPSVLLSSIAAIVGLLVDQEYGLLIYAPIFLLGGYGLIAWAQADRKAAGGAALLVGTYVATIVCPVTNAHGWTGGWSPPARLLVPIVPLLAIGIAIGITRAPRAVVIPLVALQIGIDAYAWQHPKILWNDGHGRAAFCRRIGDRVCGCLPSLVDTP